MNSHPEWAAEVLVQYGNPKARTVTPERLMAVLRARAEGKTYEETGEVIGVSRERARQLDNRAWSRLARDERFDAWVEEDPQRKQSDPRWRAAMRACRDVAIRAERRRVVSRYR